VSPYDICNSDLWFASTLSNASWYYKTGHLRDSMGDIDTDVPKF
jgi:hypothetical protein